MPVVCFSARRPGSSSKECSGNGRCVCGECQCDMVPNPVPGATARPFQGPYCECNPFGGRCPTGVVDSATGNGNGTQVGECSNHGACQCDSQCDCDEGYTGLNCGCQTANNTCIAPGKVKHSSTYN